MDQDRFDGLTRSLGAAASRRGLGRALAGGGLGALVGSALGALTVDAKKKRHKKKKNKKKNKKQKTPQPVLNQFGCLDIGQPCRGDSTTCCSGICAGVAPKKGRPDTSTCVAHNTGGCTTERSACVTGNQSSLCGPEAICLATTGNAGFCAAATFIQEANCRPCSKDQDCEAAGFGPGSACVLINQGFCATPNTSCAGINGSSGTACLPPGA